VPGHPQSPQKIQTFFQNWIAIYYAYGKALDFGRAACICGWARSALDLPIQREALTRVTY
jgi:hypothetical protein